MVTSLGKRPVDTSAVTETKKNGQTDIFYNLISQSRTNYNSNTIKKKNFKIIDVNDAAFYVLFNCLVDIEYWEKLATKHNKHD